MGTAADDKMFFARLGVPTNLLTILIQLGVDGVAGLLGISALLLSLLIIPIATELPEKVNSILWIRREKDTLAFGNITGAMVFQGNLLPATGIALTPWQARIEVLSGVLVTLAAAGWLRLHSRANGLPV
jgi:cation:H+ antiporter